MEFEGKRVKQTRWIHGGACIVRVEVDAVIPVDDPSEPCFDPKTVEFLREVHEHADSGDIEWLKQVGEVYAKVPA
jgi:hypothetical protein